jgi:hypothetical protein
MEQKKSRQPAAQPVPVLSIALQPLTKWEREYQAFQRLLPQLLATRRDHYVAIHEERVVDTDPDDIALIQRVHARYGYVPIHVDRVTELPPRPARLPFSSLPCTVRKNG